MVVSQEELQYFNEVVGEKVVKSLVSRGNCGKLDKSLN